MKKYLQKMRTGRKVWQYGLCCLWMVSLAGISSAYSQPTNSNEKPNVYEVSTVAYSANKDYLTVGDAISNVYLNKIVNYPLPAVDLSHFGGKSMIIAFWAPWCLPCLKSLPKLDSFVRVYKDQLIVLPVTREKEASSLKILDNLKASNRVRLNYSIIEDDTLYKLFPHKVIPHYVWINNKGIIKAITGAEDVTDANISAFMSGNPVKAVVKNDYSINLDYTKPFFIDYNKLPSGAVMHSSVLTRHIQGIDTESNQLKTWIRSTNSGAAALYKLALGEFDLSYLSKKRLILEGFETMEDSLKVGVYSPANKALWREVYRDYVYNYELVFPDSTYNRSKKFAIMTEDLNRYFSLIGVTGRREVRKMEVYKLIRTSKEDKMKTKGGTLRNLHTDNMIDIVNIPLTMLVSDLQSYFSDMGTPLVDGTGYRYKVDISIKGDWKDILSINAALKPYELEVVKAMEGVPMAVLTLKK